MAGLIQMLATRWLMSLIPALGICVLIWFYGPWIVIGGYQPLGPELVRIVIILAIMIAWGLFNRSDGKKADGADEKPKKASKADAKTEGAAPSEDEKKAIEREVGFLRREFAGAMRILRRSKSGRGLGGRWRYQLPWYMVMGEADAGKSSLVANSGLSFPLGEPTEPAPDRELDSLWAERIGFWFSDDSVLIEPPGQFLEEAADQPVAGGVWTAFLDEIRRNRPRQPLNGIVLSISLPDIVDRDEAEIRQRASRLKQRLREIRTRLRLRLPVYVVFTKSDRLAGFTEFFDTFPRDVRNQVLGVTLPLTEEKANSSPLAALEPEFDALLESLNARVLERLHQEPDMDRRGLAFGFPQQLALARGRIHAFLQTLFQVSRYEEWPLARGIYFTSAEQGGEPVDLILETLADAVPGHSQPEPLTGRRSFFIVELLRGVIFKESNLAGIDPRFERKRRLRFMAITGGTALATVLLLLAWQANHRDSRALLDRADRGIASANQSIAALENSVGNLSVVGDTEFRSVAAPLGTLDAMRDDIQAAVNARPFRTRLGNYRGRTVLEAADNAYDQALESLLLPRLLLQMERRIRDGSLGYDPLYQALRVYLMVGREGPMDRPAVMAWLTDEWRRVLPGPENLAVRDALAGHAAALFSQDYETPDLDRGIVDTGRERLAGYPMGERGYALLQELPRVDNIPRWRPVDHAGPLAGRGLVRRSGRSLSDGMRGLYTYDGYHEVGKPAADQVARDLSGEGWVLGRSSNPEERARDAVQIRDDILQIYVEDYARQWDGLLADISIAPFRDVEHAADVLNVVSGPSSPLKELLAAVVTQTTLSPGPDASAGNGDAGGPGDGNGGGDGDAGAGGENGVAGALSGLVPVSLASEGDRESALMAEMLEQAPDAPPERYVNDRFSDLRSVVGDGDGAGLQSVLDNFRDAYEIFTRLSHGPSEDGAITAALDGSSSGGIPVTVALANAAEALPGPVGDMVSEVARNSRAVSSGGAQEVISTAWQDDVLPVCSAALPGRYPVDPAADQNVPVGDFAALFSPGGTLDGFFTTQVASFVDQRQDPWALRDSRAADLGLAASTPAFFEQVDEVRNALFPDGAEAPTIRFQLRPRELDAWVDQVVLDVNDRRLTYGHGVRETQTFEWVAADDSQVRIFFTPDLHGEPGGLVETGPWSLLKFLDHAQVEPAGAPDRYTLTIALGGRQAVFDLTASSVDNPFGADIFQGLSCPASL
ncbi:type VI secretion system membrane subunit TssM [Fodinicurvata sp. EGI_FJ10296]|uniref:type VI secretion system membrane subunit TssM n=1 Tax=Fodinicurvata sp. EGI_FJ10296 TaxID=3231908 RepID=UPI0034516BF1